MQYSKWGLTRADGKGRITSLNLHFLCSLRYDWLSGLQVHIAPYPQSLLHSAALNPFIPQVVLILGIAPTRVQGLALGLVTLHEVKIPMGIEYLPSMHSSGIEGNSINPRLMLTLYRVGQLLL